MSLVDSMMESYTILDKTSVSDGEGGMITRYVPGASIQAAATEVNTLENIVAEAASLSVKYKILTHRDVLLEFHQVLRRDSDGKTFRVTSNGKDRRTPNIAHIQYSQVDADAWEIPTEAAI